MASKVNKMTKKVKKDSLGDRMKRYESVSKNRLVSRIPVILRLDGVAFHNFTRYFVKPFDNILVDTMQEVTKYLCKNIQGCVFGYTQSDEITLVLVDYKKLNSSAWFDNEVQKLCSVAASMCTMKFNELFFKNTEHYGLSIKLNNIIGDSQYIIYKSCFNKAYFDCRAFNIPKEDVCNNIIWRQQDATRNSIQALAQAHFSHKELMNKNCNQLQDMLHEQKGINWNDLPIHLKRGTAVIKKERIGNDLKVVTNNKGDILREWVIDLDMPILTQNREYVEKFINIGE